MHRRNRGGLNGKGQRKMEYFVVAVKQLGAEKPSSIERHYTQQAAEYRAGVVRDQASRNGWNVKVAVIRMDGGYTATQA